MIAYSKFQPTGFDPKGLGLEDQQDWLVVEVSHNRDSGPLDKSNWESLVKSLDKIDPDGKDHEAHSFNHWGPGWFEIMLVRPGSACETEAEEIEGALSDYPVLDEEDYSRRTHDEACEAWEHTRMRDRIKILARHNCSIFAARRDEIPEGLPYYDDFYREEG
jgi:hypothetical protein